MALHNSNPTTTIAWQKLQNHFQEMQNVSMSEMFNSDTNRTSQFHIQWNDFLIDYSKNIINQETVDLLLELANQSQLKESIAKYFEGDIINQTENRAVLHTALRAKDSAIIKVDGENVIPEVFEVKNNCTGIVKQIKKNGEFKKGNTYCGY